MFVAEYQNSDTIIFDKNLVRIGKINDVGTPVTDSTGLVYLSLADLNYIHVYAPPYDGKPTEIGFGEGVRINTVAVDPKTNIFALVTQTRGGEGKVYFYRRGTTQPCKMVETALDPAYGVAFDGEGTLFFTAEDSAFNEVVASTSGECAAKTVVTYKFAGTNTNKLIPLSAIGFDKNDRFLAQEIPAADVVGPIYTYNHPQNGTFAAPIASTVLARWHGLTPTFLGVSNDGKHIWASFFVTTLGYYNYPAGGKPVFEIPNVDQANGVAMLPPLIP